MKTLTSKPKCTEQHEPAPATHAPQLPRKLERIRKRAEEFYAARCGMIGLTLNDWLKAEQEVKRGLEK